MQSFQIAVTWFGRKLAWKNEDGSFFVGDWFLWASYISVALQALVTLFKTLIQVKFIYSEKATKFCEISTNYLSYVLPVK